MVFCIVDFSRQEESFEFLKIFPEVVIATPLYRRFGECQVSAINDSEESTENSEQLLEFESKFEKRRVSVNEKTGSRKISYAIGSLSHDNTTFLNSYTFHKGTWFYAVDCAIIM